MDNSQLETMFNDQLPKFLGMFDNEIRRQVHLQNSEPEFVWKQARETVIHRFWVIDQCYAAHGIENQRPINEQSLSSRLGRKVAGAMRSRVVALTEELAKTSYYEEEQTVSEPTQTVSKRNGTHRFQEIGSIKDIPTKQPSTSFSSELARELEKVKKGQYISFKYSNRKDAINDQQLLASVTRSAGWYKGLSGKERPYRSKLIEENGSFWLHIYHLSEPVKAK